MIRMIFLCALVLVGFSVQAKTVSTGNYTSMSAEFRPGITRAELIKLVEEQKRLANKRAQVIVLPFDVSATPIIKKQAGDQAAKNAVVTQLIKGGVEIVDRGLPTKVSQELDYIEATGSSRGVSFNIADYLFTGQVLNASSGKEYTEAKSYTVDGKSYTNPATCTLNANATVSVLMYTMNPLELHKTMVLEGKAASKMENLSSSSCSRQNNDSLRVTAVTNAVANHGKKIEDVFAPKGYIIDRRYHNKKGKPDKGKNMIFKTTLPGAISTEKNTRVIIFKIRENEDALTGEITREKALIGKGEVIETLGDSAVWIKMDKAKEAKDILLGDTVEVSNSTKCAWNDLSCIKSTAF